MPDISSFKGIHQQTLASGSLRAEGQTETRSPGQSASEGMGNASKTPSRGFSEYLKESIGEVNQMQQSADKMATDVATGKAENIHETMLALSQAELSFKLMVQIRNKALEAYQEVMRMPV